MVAAYANETDAVVAVVDFSGFTANSAAALPGEATTHAAADTAVAERANETEDVIVVAAVPARAADTAVRRASFPANPRRTLPPGAYAAVTALATETSAVIEHRSGLYNRFIILAGNLRQIFILCMDSFTYS